MVCHCFQYLVVDIYVSCLLLKLPKPGVFGTLRFKLPPKSGANVVSLFRRVLFFFMASILATIVVASSTAACLYFKLLTFNPWFLFSDLYVLCLILCFVSISSSGFPTLSASLHELLEESNLTHVVTVSWQPNNGHNLSQPLFRQSDSCRNSVLPMKQLCLQFPQVLNSFCGSWANQFGAGALNTP